MSAESRYHGTYKAAYRDTTVNADYLDHLVKQIFSRPGTLGIQVWAHLKKWPGRGMGVR